MTMTQLQQVSERALDGFRARFAGQVLTSADGAEYDAARAVFNAMFDRRPAVIARAPRRAIDVAAALDFARREGLPIAVRGGGHSVAGYSTIDDGFVIDLGRMKGIEVDPESTSRLGRARCDLGRVRRRSAAARARHHGWPHDDHRRRRLHARQRKRLAGTHARLRLRQPHLRRGRARRRQHGQRQQGDQRRTLLGPLRRRRKLRDRHVVRVPAASGRAR